FRVARLGRASYCHYCMCQKAFGGIGGSLVTAHGLEWTRGAPAHFQSSNKVRRGLRVRCGTPLTFEHAGAIDIAIAAFDRAGETMPVMQLAAEARLPWADGLASIPGRAPSELSRFAPFLASIVSNQQPDHAT